MDDQMQSSTELREENSRLRAEVQNLRNALSASETEFPIPRSWKLTKCEELFVRTLLRRDFADKRSLYHALYGDRIDGGPDPKIIDVFVCKIRKKLAPLGFVIETVWGRGYSLADRKTWATAISANTLH